MPWSEPGLLVACAAGALAISAGGTAWAIAYARRRGMLDQPGERRSHATATPRGGGIGIVVAILVALGMLGWSQADPSWWWMAAGLMLVAGVGWWDDHRPLSIAVRLSAHFVAGAALAWSLSLQGAGLPAVLATLVLVPGLVNAWNFMDGIDGLAASQALLCAIGWACLLAGPWQLLGVVLALAKMIEAEEGVSAARQYLSQQLKDRPSVRGEAALIDLTLAEHADTRQADAEATLHDLKHITDQLLVRNPSYRCNRCGFGARSHHWQCPSCKEWGTVKPLLNYAVV